MRARRCEISVSLSEQMLVGLSFTVFLFHQIYFVCLRISGSFQHLFSCKHLISFGCLHIRHIYGATRDFCKRTHFVFFLFHVLMVSNTNVRTIVDDANVRRVARYDRANNLITIASGVERCRSMNSSTDRLL